MWSWQPKSAFQAGWSLRTTLVLGGQAGIGDRARIGARVQLGGQGGLLPDKSIGPGGAYWGTPARPLREQLARQALVNRLPQIFGEMKKLRARVKELEES